MNLKSHNPDVLTCIANLSSDEVFTPPKLANEILDILPSGLWSDRQATFLDPVCKSGVFLREMAKRLDVGLKKKIPKRQKRINHIFSKQLFGIGITELTSLLARRSVYCSKNANGKYSVCETFDDTNGNISFELIEHTWENGRCAFCGASQANYERGQELETHAYEFIHIGNPEEIFNMKFDVIVGNPPYQLNDRGGMGTSAIPLYHKFVQQAIKLNPRFLTMIIPARWFSGGKGLDEFRNNMLRDKQISKLVDYFDSVECFPGVDISGGVCIFLWEKNRNGDCEVTSHINKTVLNMTRPLLEEGTETFIRFNEAVSVYRKVRAVKENSIVSIISPRRPFGINPNINIQQKPSKTSIKFYDYGKEGFVKRAVIKRNHEWVDSIKVFIAKAYGERGSFPYRVLTQPFLGDKNSCCSETYLVVGPFSSRKKANNAISYIHTKFFRFLVLLKKNTQNAPKGVYEFVPIQDFNEPWTDEKLYKKYGLNKDEIDFIESMVRPMETNDE